ncbi:MAG TPA: restriction endonuclease subunit S [Nitrospira sp.]|nr:restriction endonuclease subunit S [Nitrospira sp.]
MCSESMLMDSRLPARPPAGWKEVPLRAVTDTRFSNVDKLTKAGERPVRLCNYTDVYNNDYITQDIEFMEATAAQPEIDKFRLQVGDVIITKDSETPYDIGIPARVDCASDDLVCGYHLALLRPNQEVVDPDYLSKQLGHARLAGYFARMANGLTRYGLSIGAIDDSPIWLPPQVEQSRIGYVLRQLDLSIVQTETLIGKLNQAQAGLLHDLLTLGLPGLARGLLKRIVGDICETYAGGTPPRSASGMYGGGILWVKSGELGKGSITSTEETITELGLAASSAKWVPANVPLVAMYGATAGAVGWLTVKATTNQAVLACVPKSSAIDARWLYWRLRFDSDKLISAIQGSGQPNLNKGLVDRHAVDIPPTPDEQSEIASILDAAEAEILAQRAYLQTLRSIKVGLTDDLITGRVRVPAELEMA